MKHSGLGRHARRASLWVLLAGLFLASGVGVYAIVTDLSLVAELHEPAERPLVDQEELRDLVRNGQAAEAFEEAFEVGDEFFGTQFNALDGVGANVGRGQRFTRVPRADLSGPGQWRNHIPVRATGPNALGCFECHETPAEDGAGLIGGNVIRDPQLSGSPGRFIQRNTPHVFAAGAVQKLAEEMTAELHAIRSDVRNDACSRGSDTDPLVAKGLSFGQLTARRVSSSPCRVQWTTSGVRGVDAGLDAGTGLPNLVVKPFQWKGSVASLRDFNRGAGHNELGIQAVEITGDGVDGDFDGVRDEASISDMTTLAIYLAAQPRPTTKTELEQLGLIEPLSAEQRQAIARGGTVFRDIGCATCHVPSMRVRDRRFREPSQSASYRDATFPAGQDPVERAVDPRYPVSFDITADQPDNVIHDDAGNVVFRLGSFRRDGNGDAIVELFGDLRRHYMGSGLAEQIDEVGTGAATFLTENLWGVGSTGPYMHDGRSTTLTEAILEHGGEAADSRDAFRRRSHNDQAGLIAYLDNLVLFKMEEEEEEGVNAFGFGGGIRQVVKVAPKGVKLRFPLKR
jgi:hypothetical protein